jgi:cytochrome c-type biogenesis protein CcmH
MLFTLLFVALTLGTATVLCLPLLRGVPTTPERGRFDRAVYRDQLKEVERDLTRGVLSQSEAEGARLEIQRRLLSVDAAAPPRPARSEPSPLLAGIIAASVLFGSAALYLRFGTPSLPDAPFADRPAQQTAGEGTAPHLDLRQAAQALEQKLRSDPSNAQGWTLYGRTEAMLGDWQKAAGAYRHAIDLGQKTSETLSAYGEMLVLAADGIVSPAAHDTFTQVLTTDPKNEVARYYLALADSQAGEEQRAIDRWVALAGEIPSDSPMREAIARGIAQAAKAGGLTAPDMPRGTPPDQQPDATQSGPTQDQMAAAAQMPEAQRNEMIRGMVAQLAAHLKTEPNDIGGWLRLGRSYAVLGDTDQAADAYDHAIALKPDDVGIKLQAFQALIIRLQPSDPLPPRAVTLLHQVVALAPDQPEALWYLGVQAVHDGNPGEARQEWTKLLATLPADGEDAKLVKSALDALPAK